MIGRHNIIRHDWLFDLFRLLLALATIVVFGYLFCRTHACY
jgi:hypothetical protein